MSALVPVADAIPVLLYHAVTDRPSAWVAPFTVTPARFARQLDLVVSSGRTPLTTRALCAGLAGEAALPRAPVAIAFDDGFADLLDTVMPLLADRGLPASVFLTTGFLDGTSPGGDRMLSWSGAQQLAAAGLEIGAHSVSHPELDVLDASAQRREVVDCRRALQDRLGLPIEGFAYPHGYSDPRVRRIVAAAGYTYACAVRNAFSHPGDRLDAIARLTVTADADDDRIGGWLTGLGARRASRSDSPATRGWRVYRRWRHRR